jgi:hypothetical protein
VVILKTKSIKGYMAVPLSRISLNPKQPALPLIQMKGV